MALCASVNMSPQVVYIGYGPPYRTIYQSINQYLSASMPHGTRAQAGPKQHYNTNNPYIHTQKTVDLDNVSFTYIVYNSVYNSVKGLQHREFSLALRAKTRLPHSVDNRCCLVVVASQAQDSCRGIFIRNGGMIMTLFQ